MTPQVNQTQVVVLPLIVSTSLVLIIVACAFMGGKTDPFEYLS